AVQQALSLRDRYAVVVRRKLAGPFAQYFLAMPGAGADVPLTQFIQHRAVRTVFVQHDFLRAAVEAREMVEPQRLAIDQHTISDGASGLAGGDVPGGDVESRRAQHADVVE